MISQYDTLLVAASVVTAIVASNVALELSSSVTQSTGRVRLFWLIAGSAAMGMGICSMHFIGMLAFQMPEMEMYYDVFLVGISVLVAIGASLVALSLACRANTSKKSLWAAAFAMGLGIAGMHYIGMASMRMHAKIEWNAWLVCLSVAVAILASYFALSTSDFLRAAGLQLRKGKIWFSSLLMGCAISGMHYIGMLATTFVSGGMSAPGPLGVLPDARLSLPVILATVLIFSMALAGILIQRLLSKVRLATEESRSLYENANSARLELQDKNKQLADKEVRFQQLVRSVVDYAIYMLDPEGKIVTWNEGAKRLKGYEESEILGKHFSIFYPQEEVASGKPERELKEATLYGKYADEGWRIRKNGTRFWANIFVSAIRDLNGELLGFSKVTRDLTERKLAEDKLREAYGGLEQLVRERTAELEKAKDEAEQAVRMRDEFLSIASHELKTPITSLSLQLDLFSRALKKGLEEENVQLGANAPHLVLIPAKTAEIVAKCRDQSKRLTALLDELLDLTRIRLGRIHLEKENVDLSEEVRKVAERFRTEATQKGSVITVHADSPVIGYWDPLRIEQVVTNLISNAVKYGDGKEISVTVGHDESKASLIVQDHGIGIPPDVQGQIFERFERGNVKGRKYPGLGLGLYICRQILRAHGGAIRVESGQGRGATFFVEIPFQANVRAEPYRVDSTKAG